MNGKLTILHVYYGNELLGELPLIDSIGFIIQQINLYRDEAKKKYGKDFCLEDFWLIDPDSRSLDIKLEIIDIQNQLFDLGVYVEFEHYSDSYEALKQLQYVFKNYTLYVGKTVQIN